MTGQAWEEIDKVKHSVRLDENRVTEVQAAVQNSVQKVNTEITYLHEQLAARQSTDCAIPSKELPVMAVGVESSSQLNSELAAIAGNYHMAIVMLIIVGMPSHPYAPHAQPISFFSLLSPAQ